MTHSDSRPNQDLSDELSALRAIVEGTAGHTGQEFFRSLVRHMAAAVPDIEIPGWLEEKVAADPMAGVDAVCEQIRQLQDSGAYDGVHLVPVSRYRQVAARLEAQRRNSDG